MRIGVVIQRYGLEIGAGAERHCRDVVERLSDRMDLEVLTSCARDYLTWENEYPAGPGQENGVPVRRFPTTGTRDRRFRRRAARVYGVAHTLQDEMEWLRAQGPVVPGLLQHLDAHPLDEDAVSFFT